MLREEVVLPRQGTSRLAPPPRGSRAYAFEAELTIHYRLLLVAANPPGGAAEGTARDVDGAEVPTLPWPSGRFVTFRDDLARQIEHAWDRAFYLVGHFGDRGRAPRSPPARVECRLELDVRPVDDGQRDGAYRVHFLDRRQLGAFASFRSSTTRVGRLLRDNASGTIDANLYGDLDDGDAAAPVDDAAGQVVGAHEFGHLLRLHHPGGSSNAPHAYHGNPWMDADLMGAGTTRRTWHAVPWLWRLSHHLSDSQYSRVRWEPHVHRMGGSHSGRAP